MGPVLLERDGVIAAVDALVRRAVAGDGGAVLVEAPAGLGKTAVLARARATDGMRVLAARAVDLERSFPLGVARQLLEPLLRSAGPGERERWLSGVAALAGPVLAGAARDVGEPSAFNALYWLLAGVAADEPVLIAVDDLHWSDAESLRWLDFVVRRLDGLPVAVVLATRNLDARTAPALLALAREPGLEVLALQRLSPVATETLVRRRLPDADAAFASACHRACGGNPFLLHELLAAVDGERIAPVVANAERVGSLASAGLQRAVLGRLASLGPDDRALARALAVLGGEAPLSAAACFAGIGLEAAASAASALEHADVLAAGPPPTFRHPLLRAAVLADMGAVAVSAEHARAARFLRERDARPEAVAVHLGQSEPVGEPWAADLLARAADAALAHASPARAAQLFERALAEPVAPERRGALRAELGGALVTAGDERGNDELLAAFDDAADPVIRGVIAARLFVPLAMSGRAPELPHVFDQALDGLPAEAAGLHVSLVAARAMAAMLGSGERLREHALAGLALAEAGTPSPQDLAQLAAAAGISAAVPEREAVALARRALGGARAQAAAIAAGAQILPAIGLLGVTEHHEGVLEAFTRNEEAVRVRGAEALGIVATLSWRAVHHLTRGALLDAEADAEAALAIGAPGSFAGRRNLAAVVLGWLRTERGAPARGLELVEAQLAETRPQAAPFALLATVRSRALLALGRPRDAAEAALEAGRDAAAHDYDGPMVAPWRLAAAEALGQCGEADDAQDLARAQLAAAECWGGAGPIGCAQRVCGVLARDADLLARAERTLSASVMRLEHARALVELGAALRREGRRAAAREPLAEGMELAHRCTAGALVARAEEELRAAGARPRSVVRTGLDALTPSELRTARLAAEGLTNRAIAQRLFVSQKTVETQLRAAYRKLDISGRERLAAALDG